ncbi:hypothetical protein BG57_17565 [Caballeronia grimmiae]|uniref:Uncharacterized protein n=1 Tax=Caballeronia grimmiae TaxID=1071679 RepID=A0A069P7W2_9BURK|nr:hypothetical protein BG57_17565 [Caballeronia grimmiae]
MFHPECNFATFAARHRHRVIHSSLGSGPSRPALREAFGFRSDDANALRRRHETALSGNTRCFPARPTLSRAVSRAGNGHLNTELFNV